MSEPDFSTMTLAQLEALAERFGNAVKTINEARALLGGAPPAPQQHGLRTLVLPSGAPAPSPDSPFPCAACGRVRPERPGESVKPEACDMCGNRLPGGAVPARIMNKGEERRHGATTAVVQPLSAEERAAKLALPAFGSDGLPLDEDVS